MGDFPECGHLTGRMRDICEGRTLSRKLCNQYRATAEFGGLPPLPLTDTTPRQIMQSRATSERRTKLCCKPRGPGTELKALLHELGIPAAWCEGCTGRASQMDRWGVAGCRERREKIVGWITEQKNAAGWLAQATVVANLVRTGLILRIHSVGDLVDEAIRRAEKNQEACECQT